MAMYEDIAAELLKLEVHKNSDKLTRFVAQRYLKRLLKNIEENLVELYKPLGMALVEFIKDYIESNQSQGRIYKVIEDGTKRILKENYVASAPGFPPSINYTGTLHNSVDFKITPEGRLLVGVLKSPGTEWESVGFKGLSQEESAKKGYSGVIYVKPKKGQQSVEDYAKYLEEGTDNMEARPFISPVLRGRMAGVWRKDLRDAFKTYVRKQTKGKLHGGKTSLYLQVRFPGGG